MNCDPVAYSVQQNLLIVVNLTSVNTFDQVSKITITSGP